MSASSAIAFFNVKPTPAERKAKAKAKPRRKGLSERERSACIAYFRASATERKAMLRDQVSDEDQARLVAFKLGRRNYMRTYRAMKRMATTLL
jgi:hypothetical protein